MVRYRDIKTAVLYIHAKDPESSLCYSTVRNWAVAGLIRSARAGRNGSGSRILIDLDDLLEFLEHPEQRQPRKLATLFTEEELQPITPGYIRPIPE